ncbi:hypothetical protein PVT67_07665 [Gallaecimonas kandeliae]|uniref:hypothetical protein n=1 Tax=Gallaecimonas kandeliae TaxID=3029055 RepID=UPI002647553C|nr:hypothetical protein [Gallaecimonas kandeliae]WKE67102.1 hypothetical protein PVT67_07665 [Gallaecimonas kandeliae]
MFHLIRNSELEVTLNVSGVDDHLPSVAFNIGVTWNMPFQKASIEILECWFECSAIDDFHSELKTLVSLENGTATLSDLSYNPVVIFTKSGNEFITQIFTQDSSDLGRISLKVNGYSTELSEIAERLGNFEKWW